MFPGVLLLHVNEGASKTHYIDISRWFTPRQPWVVRDVVDHCRKNGIDKSQDRSSEEAVPGCMRKPEGHATKRNPSVALLPGVKSGFNGPGEF